MKQQEDIAKEVVKLVEKKESAKTVKKRKEAATIHKTNGQTCGTAWKAPSGGFNVDSFNFEWFFICLKK